MDTNKALSTETLFGDEEDHLIDLKSIKWFSVKTRLFETEQEQKEKQMAIRHQYDLGIIQANGLPVGVRPEQVGLPSNFGQNNAARPPLPRKQRRELQRAQERAQKAHQGTPPSNQSMLKKFGL